MCGIAAIVGAHATRERAERMADAIRHRGPDDVGLLVEPGIALAHRRLSIIDLSVAGHQPMATRDGRYHIIYNGEVYNYRELAAKLDVPWRSASDTEVVLEAFAAWGPRCLDELVGMFAFAIWDRVERRLFCARDRVGIKPLYYARLGDGWAIGSEIGALLAAGVPARANERIIHDFLARDFYDHDDASFFAGIAKLPPAHSMWLLPEREPAPTRYWDLAREAAAITVPADRTERGEQLIAHMADAVRLSLRSDVPVGITLSGGLDSATLLTLVDRAQPDKLAAFSFDFDDERQQRAAVGRDDGEAHRSRGDISHRDAGGFRHKLRSHHRATAGAARRRADHRIHAVLRAAPRARRNRRDGRQRNRRRPRGVRAVSSCALGRSAGGESRRGAGARACRRGHDARRRARANGSRHERARRCWPRPRSDRQRATGLPR
jgi:asparagine synthase (glutamine-hydrolysing)